MSNTILETRLIKIGNSQGICIPTHILEAIGMVDTIEIEVCNDHLILRPPQNPREGWTESFREMAANNDDVIFNDNSWILTEWEQTEWEWK